MSHRLGPWSAHGTRTHSENELRYTVRVRVTRSWAQYPFVLIRVRLGSLWEKSFAVASGSVVVRTTEATA